MQKIICGKCLNILLYLGTVQKLLVTSTPYKCSDAADGHLDK